MTEAEKNLRECQQQLDADGVMVGVSRQAIHEVLAETDRLRAALERLGSMEAFTNSFRLSEDTPAALELRARIDFARASLKPTE